MAKLTRLLGRDRGASQVSGRGDYPPLQRLQLGHRPFVDEPAVDIPTGNPTAFFSSSLAPFPALLARAGSLTRRDVWLNMAM